MEVIKSGRCMTQYSTPTEREKIMEQLTLDNPAYKAAKRRSPWGTSNLSPYLFFYERAGRELLMPRNFVPEGVQCHFRYSLNSAPVLYPKFRLELRGDQQLAYEAWEKEKRRDGLFIMQTGKGKTIAALYMAAKARERVLIVVQKNDLIHGWQEDIKLAFGVSEGSIGLIKEKHRRIGRCFTLTTIQTLSKLPASELYEISKNFGMIVQDECFPAGTLIDGKDISTLKVGDTITTFNHALGKEEQRRVAHTFKRKPTAIIKLRLTSGKEIVCTPEHPFYTQRGYVPAIYLTVDDEMHTLQYCSDKPYKGADRCIPQERADLLLTYMQPAVQRPGEGQTISRLQSPACLGAYAQQQSHAPEGDTGEGITNTQATRERTRCTRREWEGNSVTPQATGNCFKEIQPANRVHSADGQGSVPTLLQHRHCFSPVSSCDRDRWRIAQHYSTERIGSKEDSGTYPERMESIEIQEPTSDGTFGGLCPDGFVYNVETEENHNYFVAGVLVHNCHKAPAASYVCLDHMRVRHLIGFTATPNRNDGLLPLLYWRFGKTIFKSKEQGDADEDIMTFSVRIHETAIQYWPEPEYMKGYRKVSQEEAALYADTHDHALREAPMDAHLRDAAIELNNAYMLKLASDVAAEVKQKKSCLVLFRKKMSIALLKEILIDKKGIPAAYIQEYVGGSKDDGLLKGRAERKEVYVTLATLAKATEGTNVKAWERLFLASSLKNEKDIVQAIGRVRRRTEGKPNVIVYDYRHPGVKGMRTHETNRDKVYRKLKATVEGTEPKRKKGAFSHGFSEIRRR